MIYDSASTFTSLQLGLAYYDIMYNVSISFLAQSLFPAHTLRSVMSDLFTAGSDTTTNTLGWAFLYLLNYPDVQAKIRKELDRVIGSDRLPTLNDRKKYE